MVFERLTCYGHKSDGSLSGTGIPFSFCFFLYAGVIESTLSLYGWDFFAESTRVKSSEFIVTFHTCSGLSRFVSFRFEHAAWIVFQSHSSSWTLTKPTNDSRVRIGMKFDPENIASLQCKNKPAPKSLPLFHAKWRYMIPQITYRLTHWNQKRLIAPGPTQCHWKPCASEIL